MRILVPSSCRALQPSSALLSKVSKNRIYKKQRVYLRVSEAQLERQETTVTMTRRRKRKRRTRIREMKRARL